MACTSQAVAQVDTLFWFVAPEVIAQHDDSPVFLRISTFDDAATVTLSQPANPGFAPIVQNIPANSTFSIDLTPWLNTIENKPSNTVLPYGLRLSSTTQVTAYYEVNADFNPDIFALKGRNALGTDFRLPFQTAYDISTVFGVPLPRAGFDVVATADGTVVSFTPTANFVGHPAGVPVSINLDAGDTYSFIAEGLDASTLPAGTRVQSNLPIAITIKHDSSTLSNCFDLVGDQIVPIDIVGTDYIVMKGFLDNSERIFVTATADDTEVAVGGTVVATIQAGEVYSQIITAPSTFVKMSAPAYLFHVSGFGCELGGALLPSILCTGSTALRFTRSNAQFFGLNIMVPSGAEGNFSLNGSTTLVPASAFDVVPGTNGDWVAAQLSFSQAQIGVAQNVELSISSNDQFHLGIIHGENFSGCRYGYFSDFATGLSLGPPRSKCPGELTTLDAGSGQESYEWSTGETTQTIDVVEPGMYWVNTVNTACALSDTIVVSDWEPFDLQISGDLDICPGQDTELSATDGFTAYSWSTGDSTSTTTTSPGTWWVTAIDINGCSNADTAVVVLLPTPELTITGPGSVCAGSTAILSATPGLASYLWSGGETTQSINAIGGIYGVTVSNAEGCTASAEFVLPVIAPLAQFEASPNPVFGTGQITSFLDLSLPASEERPLVFWQWDFGDGESAFGSNPEHTYTEAGDYIIVLTVTDTLGCESIATLEYEVVDDLTVPNVITPNGDGANDFFEIEFLGRYPPVALTVFNRWGKEVYFSESYAEDWNSPDQPGGVYYYLLDLKDGRKLTGTVTVIK